MLRGCGMTPIKDGIWNRRDCWATGHVQSLSKAPSSDHSQILLLLLLMHVLIPTLILDLYIYKSVACTCGARSTCCKSEDTSSDPPQLALNDGGGSPVFPKRYHSSRRCLSIRLLKKGGQGAQCSEEVSYTGDSLYLAIRPESIIVEAVEARVIRIGHRGAQLRFRKNTLDPLFFRLFPF